MATPGISLARLKEHIETLSTFGRNADGHGITRSCWSPAHEEARAWLLGRMKTAGLETRVDAAGNTFGVLPGEGAAVLTGSHIDMLICATAHRYDVPIYAFDPRADSMLGQDLSEYARDCFIKAGAARNA